MQARQLRTASRTADSRRERERAFRHRLVLEAAEGVFAAEGFQAASVEQIASRAEVAIATLYKMFGSKEEIFAALVEQRQEDLLAIVGALARAEATAQERMRRLIDSIFRYFDAHQDAFRIYLGATHGFPWHIRSSLGERAFGGYRQFMELLAALIRDGVTDGSWELSDAERTAAAIAGALNGLLTHRYTMEPRAAVEDDVKTAAELVLRTVAAAKPRERQRSSRGRRAVR